MSINENMAITSETFNYDNLFVTGAADVVTDSLIIASGNNLKRGTVLGIVTASGKAVAVDSSKATGEQAPYAILASDADATSADVTAPVYLTGEFNSNKLIFGGTDTVATHKAALRKIGIFAKNAVPAV